MNKSEDKINITIKVGNSRDWAKIMCGRSYYFYMKRNTPITDLKKEFTRKFPDDITEEILRYSLFTKTLIRLHDDNVIEDYLSYVDISELNLYDKDEHIFYAILI